MCWKWHLGTSFEFLKTDILYRFTLSWASQVALVVRNLPAHAGDTRHAGLIPGWRRSPGGRHSNPLQYSYLNNPKDRGAWQATVHGIAKSQTWLSNFYWVIISSVKTGKISLLWEWSKIHMENVQQETR